MSEIVTFVSLEVWNVKGIEHRLFPMDSLCVIARGDNGAGKTSFVRALEMFFQPGGDPTLIRDGQKECKAILTLSNGYKAEKIVRRDGYEVTVRNQEGGEISVPPVTFLNSLLPRASFDPAPFLDSFDLEKRTKFLLEHLPVDFLGSDIIAIAGPVAAMNPEDHLGLEGFERVYAEKETARTLINREIEQLRGAQETLRKSLPDDTTTDWGAETRVLQDQFSKLESSIATIDSRIDLVTSQNIAQKRERVQALIVAERAKIAEAQAKIAAAEQDLRGYESQRKLEAREKKALETAGMIESKGELARKIAAASEKYEQQQRGEGVRRAVADFEEKLSGAHMRYEEFTQLLAGLKKLRAEQLQACEIPGFDIQWTKLKGARSESAVITIDGLPLDELNRQQALFVALQLVLLAQKANDSKIQSRFAVMETAELTEPFRELLKGAARKAVLQLVITEPKAGSELEVIAE